MMMMHVWARCAVGMWMCVEGMRFHGYGMVQIGLGHFWQPSDRQARMC